MKEKITNIFMGVCVAVSVVCIILTIKWDIEIYQLNKETRQLNEENQRKQELLLRNIEENYKPLNDSIN